jgi:hypothetical protein
MGCIIQRSQVNTVEKLLVNTKDEKQRPAVFGLQAFMNVHTVLIKVGLMGVICI